MRRLTVTSTVAFCVIAGLTLGEFVRAVRPVDYLIRPLILGFGLAVAIGLVASVLRRWSIPVAVFVAVWLVQPGGPIAVGVAVIVGILVAYRLWTHHAPTVDTGLITASAVFVAAGIVPIIPLLTPWHGLPATASPGEEPPQYAVLLDGYPRADTLKANGIDVSPFLDALEDRGFDIYRNATSKYYRTFQTLTELTGGTGDAYVDSIDRLRQMRENWTLPEGWVTISPPIGAATLPSASELDPGSLNLFEVRLLARSAFGPFVGDLVLNRLRDDLNRSLETLASTGERKVFAHFLAPHTPLLYGPHGKPTKASGCWPHCGDTDTASDPKNLEPIGYYAQWLNRRLLEVVDEILRRRPEAEIVLFSDHGSRVGQESDEWYRVLLAARTPSRPGLFEGSPHPRHVFVKLETHQESGLTE